MRKRIEELFGEAKEFMGLRQAKFRRRPFVREQVLMTAAAQNIKRMVRLLSKQGPERAAASIGRFLLSFRMTLASFTFDSLAWTTTSHSNYE
jgi:hypothetical protein